jgi:hypothetical protein
MTAPVVVATLASSHRESLRVALDARRGAKLLDLRAVVPLASHAATPMPTAKGVSLDVALIPQLRQALADAEEQARTLGWL